MTVPFSVELAHLNGYALVVVVGEVDLITAPDMERVLSEAVDSGIADLVVDMAACEFIDSSGIRVLVTANQKAQSLVLRSPKTAVRLVIDALGLGDILHIEEPENA
jgi:anti-sigma B factor antagonist